MTVFLEQLREAHAVSIAVQAGDSTIREVSLRTGLSVAKVSSWASALRLPLETSWQRRHDHFSSITLMPLMRPQ